MFLDVGVPNVVGCIMIVGALTHYTLIHFGYARPFEKLYIQLIRHIRPAVMQWAVQAGCVLSLDIFLASGSVLTRL